MKIFLRILSIISVAILIIAIVNLLGTYTSLKYEVEDPIAMDKAGEWLEDKRRNLNSLITWLWVISTYSIVIIVTCIKLLQKVSK